MYSNPQSLKKHLNVFSNWEYILLNLKYNPITRNHPKGRQRNRKLTELENNRSYFIVPTHVNRHTCIRIAWKLLGSHKALALWLPNRNLPPPQTDVKCFSSGTQVLKRSKGLPPHNTHPHPPCPYLGQLWFCLISFLLILRSGIVIRYQCMCSVYDKGTQELVTVC